jgi:Terminase large subunit, T4likevirus-type, N-terminal
MSDVITIPYKPRYPQTIVHPELANHRFCVLVAHRRLGKTVMAVNHVIKKAVQCKESQPRYAFIAPFLKQAKLIAWDMFKRYATPIPGVKVNEAELTIELPHNHAKIYLFGADNPDALRGTYLDGCVLDEYAQMRPNLFQEVIRPTLSDRTGWALWIGTPKGMNQFYEQYSQALRAMENKDQNWWAGVYRADATGLISADELGQLRGTLSDATFRQEYLCDWAAASDDVLITIDMVLESCARKYTAYDVQGAPRIIGIDPARFGDDRSVVVRRQGLQCFTPRIFTKLDNMTLAARIVEEINDFRADAVFIDAGGGAGIIDRLRQLGHRNIFEVAFGGSPTQPSVYANKRAEIYDSMKSWIQAGGALPPGEDVKADLVVSTYGYDAANRMKIEPKDKIKERLGKSPDIADAIAVTFAMPVQVKVNKYGENEGRGQLEFAKSETQDIFA